jgi:hypothetical protein
MTRRIKSSKIYPIAVVMVVAATMMLAGMHVTPEAYADGGKKSKDSIVSVSVDADVDASDAVDVDVSDNANDNDCNVEIIVKDKNCKNN